MGQDVVNFAEPGGNHKTHFIFADPVGQAAAFVRLNFFKGSVFEVFMSGQNDPGAVFNSPGKAVQNVFQALDLDAARVIHGAINFRAQITKRRLQGLTGCAGGFVISMYDHGIGNDFKGPNGQPALVRSAERFHMSSPF